MQNASEIKIHEINLSEFGKTPAGENLFRVVWAPTRTEKVLVKSRDEVVELLRYPGEECWLLEKWKSGFDWAGTLTQHANMCSMAPISMDYPADGEYERCDVSFPDNQAVVGFARLYVQYLVLGTVKCTEKERIKALRLREELKEKEADTRSEDMIHDMIGTMNWKGKRVKLYDPSGNIIH